MHSQRTGNEVLVTRPKTAAGITVTSFLSAECEMITAVPMRVKSGWRADRRAFKQPFLAHRHELLVKVEWNQIKPKFRYKLQLFELKYPGTWRRDKAQFRSSRFSVSNVEIKSVTANAAQWNSVELPPRCVSTVDTTTMIDNLWTRRTWWRRSRLAWQVNRREADLAEACWVDC